MRSRPSRYSDWPAKAVYWGLLGALMLLVLFIACLSTAMGQEDVQLRLVAVDTSAFPTVRLTLLSADSRSAPADFSDIMLSENGAAIEELTFDHVPHGIDVTFVLDANTGFGEIDDDSGLTRLEKTLASIHRFASDYMNPDGLDTVSIVVPDDRGQGGQFLMREASTPAEVEEALEEYDPQRLGPTPLNAMMVLALERAQQRQENGRYQAVLLLTDGRRLDQQLSFPQLTAQANDANVPIYSAILGASADAYEIANVSRLSDPTRAFHVHMPEPSATDPIYQIWQDQSNPVQITYRSRQRQSGRNQLLLNLGSTTASTSFEVMLAAPQVSLNMDETQIRRIGTGPDTPVDALQPAIQPIAVTITWPDGLPRQINEVTLIVNGQPQRQSGPWQVDGQSLFLDWDISDLSAGTVEIAAKIKDELGYEGTSQPFIAAISVERPRLASTPLPTAQTQESVVKDIQTTWLRWEVVAAAAAIVILLIFLGVWSRRKRSTSEALAANDNGATIAIDNQESQDFFLVASLEPLSIDEGQPYTIEETNVAIGSDAQNVQFFLNDGSVNRLHARIRRQEQEYWLFDEGSFEGTFLNYERLGLAPKKLSDGDTVQFGKMKFRFHLRQIINLEK